MIIKQLCDEFYPELSSQLSKLENQKKKDQAKKALHSKVIKFYNEDYITYQAPGKSDVVSVKVNNTKILMQKRYMIMSINEAYEIYCNEIDLADQIGRSKFFQLRPQNVIVVRDTPHNVCVCQIHANFINLCLALKKLTGFH